MTDEPTNAEAFTEAARLIDTYGWRQGRNGDRDTGFCVAGALVVAVGLPEGGGYLDYPVEVARWTYLCTMASDKLAKTVDASPIRAKDVTTWNDQPGRTKEEVIAFLRELAEESNHAHP